MDALVQRVRWAMNLALLGSLLLWWGLAQDTVDPIAQTRQIMTHAQALGMAHDGFRASVPGSLSGLMWGDAESPAPEVFLIRSTPVESIVKMQYGLTDLLSEYLHEGERGEAIDHFRALQNELVALEQAFNTSGLEADATVGRWVDVTRARVRIPIIDERVDMQTAMGVFSAAAIVLWLYVGSCIVTLRRVAGRGAVGASREWLFLHAGPVGPVLGIAWVLLPTAVLSYGAYRLGTQTAGSAGWLALAGVAVVSVWVLWEALRSRRVLKRPV